MSSLTKWLLGDSPLKYHLTGNTTPLTVELKLGKRGVRSQAFPPPTPATEAGESERLRLTSSHGGELSGCVFVLLRYLGSNEALGKAELPFKKISS